MQHIVQILTTSSCLFISGGNEKLKEMVPGLEVCGHEIDQCEGCNRFVADGEEFSFDCISIRCLHTPGHTQGHICYYLTVGDQKVVFTGDIMFNGGAGRFFEGTAQDVFGSFQKLLALPPETAMYCGHEYTLANYRFALTVDATNADLIEVIIHSATTHPFAPSTLYHLLCDCCLYVYVCTCMYACMCG